MNNRHLVFIFALLILLPCSASAELAILDGKHTVVYDIVNPRGVAFIPNYSNTSFEQTVTDLDEFSKRVTVTSKMGPITSREPYPIPAQRISPSLVRYLEPERDRQARDPSIVRLAQDITRGSRFAHEAANAILTWIADNLTFDTSITVKSDAVSALQYRKAFCVGYSNLAVALLRAAGIPARIAHGYLPPGYEWGFSRDYWGVKVNDGGFHAYLEIFYPDRGWFFSDAEHSHHFVDPFHILLRLDGMEMPGAYKGGYLEVDKATFYTVYHEENSTSMVDELPFPKTNRLGCRIDEQQHAALVTGKVLDAAGKRVPKGSIVVWKSGRGEPKSFSEGKFASALTESGTYRIEAKGPGYAKSSRELQIVRGKTYQLDFVLQPGGAIRGTVTDGQGNALTEGDVFYREGNTSYGVPIDRDGTYAIEGLAPGSYGVTVIAGSKEVSRKIQVDAGKVAIVDFMVK